MFYNTQNYECVLNCGGLLLNTLSKECLGSCPDDMLADKEKAKCYQECPPDSYLYIYKDKKECVNDCSYYDQIADKLNKKCQKTCPEGLYYNTITGECANDCNQLREEQSMSFIDKCDATHYLVVNEKMCVANCKTQKLYSNHLTRNCNPECPKAKCQIMKHMNTLN